MSERSAYNKYFRYYTKWISEYVIMEYGPSYSTFDDVVNKWRRIIPYSAEIANDIILKTKVFIRDKACTINLLSDRLKFIDNITDLMSEYLAKYMMRRDVNGNISHKTAQNELKTQLFTDSELVKYTKGQYEAAMQRKREHELRVAAAAEQQSVAPQPATVRRTRVRCTSDGRIYSQVNLSMLDAFQNHR